MQIKDFFASNKDPEIVEVEWLLERFRNWRKVELESSDWTQLSDSPIAGLKWVEYRQTLRDLPSLKNFADAELPVKPN